MLICVNSLTDLKQMKLYILFFGITKDIVGSNKLELDVKDEMTVQSLKEYLQNIYPEFKRLNSFAIAVNSVYVRDNLTLQTGDEIAIIPPVSGG